MVITSLNWMDFRTYDQIQARYMCVKFKESRFHCLYLFHWLHSLVFCVAYTPSSPIFYFISHRLPFFFAVCKVNLSQPPTYHDLHPKPYILTRQSKQGFSAIPAVSQNMLTIYADERMLQTQIYNRSASVWKQTEQKSFCGAQSHN